MADYPAISGIDDPANVRVMLLQGKQQVNAPLTGLGFQPAGNYQPLDTDLTAIAALVSAADKLPYATGAGTWALTAFTAFARTLLDDADAATMRATLGLGSAATKELTPWVAYTPTFTGWGTAANVNIRSLRWGDTLIIGGKFTSGTVTGVEARLTLGFNGVNGGITSDATKVPSIQFAGWMARSSAGAPQAVTLIESNVGYITFGLQSATQGSLNKVLGTDLASTVNYSFHAIVPISGW